MGFEPTTPTMARLCSTSELHPLSKKPKHSYEMWLLQEHFDTRSTFACRPGPDDWRPHFS